MVAKEQRAYDDGEETHDAGRNLPRCRAECQPDQWEKARHGHQRRQRQSEPTTHATLDSPDCVHANPPVSMPASPLADGATTKLRGARQGVTFSTLLGSREQLINFDL